MPLAAEEDRPFVRLEGPQAGIGLFRQTAQRGRTDCYDHGGGCGTGARWAAPRRVEPLAEIAAPVLATDVEMFDAERRDVDGQTRPGFVEHRAGQRRAARIGDARALVDADVEEIAHKTVAIVGTQQRERLAAPGNLHPRAAVALPTGQAAACGRLRRQRYDAVLREDATDIGACGLTIRGGVKVDAAGARGRGDCGFRRRLDLRALLGPIAQFPQPLGQDRLQSAHFFDEVARGLAQIRPAPGNPALRVVERKARHRVAALIAQKVRPSSRIRWLRADDEDAAMLAGAILDLLSEPIEFVAAPTRSEVALRHYDDQDARRGDFIA